MVNDVATQGEFGDLTKAVGSGGQSVEKLKLSERQSRAMLAHLAHGLPVRYNDRLFVFVQQRFFFNASHERIPVHLDCDFYILGFLVVPGPIKQ